MSAETPLVDSSASVPTDGATAVSTTELPEMPVSARTPGVREEAAATQEPVVPDPPRDEVERIEPDVTGPVTLENGTVVDIVPLKLRETMKLLKIVTRGAGSVLETTLGDLDMNDPVAFAQTFGALILFSIPEAENEAVEFIQSMVLPANFNTLSQQEKIDGLNALAIELANPELGDVITVVERVIRRESEDIRNLGKRISQAFQMARKVGDLPANK